MKVKAYYVFLKSNPKIFYLVDAPNKRIASWCGANLINNEYTTFYEAKDMKAVGIKVWGK